MHTSLCQHFCHRSGVVVRFQRHVIAGAGGIPRRNLPQQRSRGRLVHLLQGEHLRLLLRDEVYKNLPLCLMLRYDKAVGIQCQQFHSVLQNIIDVGFQNVCFGAVHSLNAVALDQ